VNVASLGYYTKNWHRRHFVSLRIWLDVLGDDLAELALKQVRWERRAEMRRLRSFGHTCKKIGAAYGVNAERVRQVTNSNRSAPVERYLAETDDIRVMATRQRHFDLFGRAPPPKVYSHPDKHVPGYGHRY
jgi:hypothetical protein